MELKWKTETRKISELIPFENNPRMMSESQAAELQQSLEKFGLVEIPVINADNMILAGHMRIDTLKKLGQGLDEIEVRVPNRKLTEKEAVEYLLRSNKNTGSWDQEKLKTMDVDQLLAVGFGDEELSDIWDNVETLDDDFNQSKAIEEAKNTTVKNGDIYQLGQNRLMCGDSLDEKSVGKLVGKQKMQMIYCDPPYNIGLDYGDGISTKGKYQGAAMSNKKEFPDLKYKGVKFSDYKSAAGYKKFLEFSLKNAIVFSDKNAHVFYWCDENFIFVIQELYKANDISPRRVCIWIKNNFNMTPQFAFNKVYEPCVYGTLGRPFLNPNFRNLNEVLNRDIEAGNQVHDEIFDIFNVWLVKRDVAQEYSHPTQKPVTLHEKAIKRCTAPGMNIIDLFGGSGSTMLACEQLKRKNFTMELNPIFCQVIINRWEKHTGEKAKKLK